MADCECNFARKQLQALMLKVILSGLRISRLINGLISRSGSLAATRRRTVLTETEIEEKIYQIVSEQMGIDKSELTRDTSFVDDLNADSLDTVELVMEFEDEFEMSIPDEEAEKIRTIGQIVDYVLEHCKEKK